jgi:hypothetical protein
VNLSSLLPEGQRKNNLRQLAQLLAPKDVEAVKTLLAIGGGEWSRYFPPLPSLESKIEVVQVSCHAGLLRIVYFPRYVGKNAPGLSVL